MAIRWSALLGRWIGASICAVIFAAAAPPTGPAPKIAIPEKPRADEAPRGAVLFGSGPDILSFARDLCRDNKDYKPGELILWEPGPADVDRFEKLLPAFMKAQKTPSDYQPLHEYYRQYVGAIDQGKKKICVSFFHHGFLADMLRMGPDLNRLPQGARPEDFWKYEPISVDDGGAYFFQIQFDVETGTFISLRFNGYA